MRTFFSKPLTILLLIIPFFAWIWPNLGSSHGPLYGSYLKKIAIFSLFFINGLSIDRQILKKAPEKKAFFAYISFFSLIIFPSLVVLANIYIYDALGLPPEFSLGTLILASLPTTVSSCVIFTSLSGGDHTSALIAAAITNFTGIFLSPIILGFISGIDGFGVKAIPLKLIWNMAYMILTPVYLGYFLQILSPKKLKTYKKYLPKVGTGAIALICYIVFCDNFINLAVLMCPNKHFIRLFFCMLGQYVFFLGLAQLGAYYLGFGSAEKKAVLFSAPQKTLAMGIVLISNLTAASSTPMQEKDFALYAMPLLMYHYIQLMSSGLLIPYAKKI